MISDTLTGQLGILDRMLNQSIEIPDEDFQKIKKTLETIHFYLKNNDLQVKVAELSIESKRCTHCLGPIKSCNIPKTIQLNWSHSLFL
jgi:hypothetical protein